MKKIYSLILVAVLSLGCSLGMDVSVRAAENKEYIDGSYLTNETESEGLGNISTRGEYYRSGSSTIAKTGTGKIAAGGTTVAQKVVANVSVTVRVERLVNGTWQVYTSWSATRYNAAMASTSKALSVPTGYYYRTHSFHSANSDSSSSVSNGIWI